MTAKPTPDAWPGSRATPRPVLGSRRSGLLRRPDGGRGRWQYEFNRFYSARLEQQRAAFNDCGHMSKFSLSEACRIEVRFAGEDRLKPITWQRVSLPVGIASYLARGTRPAGVYMT